MKRFSIRYLSFSILLVALLLAAPGCQSSGVAGGADPTVQLTVAEDFYATSENLLADAQRAGLIPEKDKAAIIAARNSARAALQAAQQNVATNASQFQAALAQFNAIVPQLVQWRDVYAQKK
jgi:hypothetical protein